MGSIEGPGLYVGLPLSDRLDEPNRSNVFDVSGPGEHGIAQFHTVAIRRKSPMFPSRRVPTPSVIIRRESSPLLRARCFECLRSMCQPSAEEIERVRIDRGEGNNPILIENPASSQRSFIISCVVTMLMLTLIKFMIDGDLD